MSDLFAKRKVIIYEIAPGVNMNIGTMPNVTIGTMPNVTIGTMPNVTIGTMPNVTIGSMPNVVVGSGDITITDGTIDVSKIKAYQQIDRMGTLTYDLQGVTDLTVGSYMNMFDADITSGFLMARLNDAGAVPKGPRFVMDFGESLTFKNIFLYVELFSDSGDTTVWLEGSLTGVDDEYTELDTAVVSATNTTLFNLAKGEVTYRYLRVRAYAGASSGTCEILSWVVSI